VVADIAVNFTPGGGNWDGNTHGDAQQWVIANCMHL